MSKGKYMKNTRQVALDVANRGFTVTDLVLQVFSDDFSAPDAIDRQKVLTASSNCQLCLDGCLNCVHKIKCYLLIASSHFTENCA